MKKRLTLTRGGWNVENQNVKGSERRKYFLDDQNVKNHFVENMIKNHFIKNMIKNDFVENMIKNHFIKKKVESQK
jgi:hypothetical protein